MPVVTQYKTLYGVYLNHHTETYGGVDYSRIMSEAYFDEDIITTDTSALSSSVSFLYPIQIKSNYYLDGVLKGHFKVYNSNATTAKDVDTYTVTLQTLDNTGTLTDIGTITETISGGYSITAEDTIGLPVIMELTEVEVTDHQRLVFKFEITGDTGDIELSHYNDSSFNDVMIKVPYAPNSGR